MFKSVRTVAADEDLLSPEKSTNAEMIESFFSAPLGLTCAFHPLPPERGEGHDRQNEPTEDQLCHPQQWPLDRPALLQPPGGQQDLQGDEEDGEQHQTAHRFIATFIFQKFF